MTSVALTKSAVAAVIAVVICSVLPPKMSPRPVNIVLLTLFTREYCPSTVNDLSTGMMVTSDLDSYKSHRPVRLWSVLFSRLALAACCVEHRKGASDSFAAPVKTLDMICSVHNPSHLPSLIFNCLH